MNDIPVREFDPGAHPAFRFLEIANRHTAVEPLVEEFLQEAAAVSGCGAVGFRIVDRDGNIPYVRALGFSTAFERAEGMLNPDTATCFCAQVFTNSGTVPPEHRTPYGSLWMDDISMLFESGRAGRHGMHTACYLEGFKSLALVPIRSGEATLGLIHLADREPAKLSRETLILMEYVARQLGNTLQRIIVEEKLREHNLLLTEEVKLRSVHLADSTRELETERVARHRTEELADRREAALEGLYDLATRLGSSLEQNGAYAVELMVGLLQADRAVFFCEEKGTWSTAAAYGIPTGGLPEDAHILEVFLKTALPEHGVCQAVENGMHLAGVPLRNSDTEVTGLMAVMRASGSGFGAEECRVMEIFGHYLAYEIEHRVLHTKLLKAREMEILGQLTSGLAHEVRNPLNALVANTEALFQVLENKVKYEKFVFFIRSQVERLSRLMNDLLDMGRPLQVSQLRAHPAAQLVQHAVDVWRRLASVRDVSVEIDGLADLDGWTVRADETKIQQVFINLFENAAQITGEGSLIRVQAAVYDAAVRYSVIDRGPGIPAERRRQVFEPFYTTRRGGSGLGLSIVRHIVGLHNGSVRVDDAPGGCGAMFIVSLPGIREEGA